MHRLQQLEAWASRNIETGTGRTKSGIAALEAAVPLIAVVIGMMAFAVVVHFSAR